MRITITALVLCAWLAFGVTAQQSKPAGAPAAVAPTPAPTPLPPLVLDAAQVQRLALLEMQLEAARQAHAAAEARYNELVKTLFLEKGGSLATHDLVVQRLNGQGALGFAAKAAGTAGR